MWSGLGGRVLWIEEAWVSFVSVGGLLEEGFRLYGLEE